MLTLYLRTHMLPHLIKNFVPRKDRKKLLRQFVMSNCDVAACEQSLTMSRTKLDRNDQLTKELTVRQMREVYHFSEPFDCKKFLLVVQTIVVFIGDCSFF